MLEASAMNRRRKVLLVDDDAALRTSLAEQLAAEYDTAEAGSGSAALAAAKSEPFDAILLDIGLPDSDGRQVCRKLREAGVACPIIMLTGATAESDTVAGLDAGANDYVAKPFRLGELMARIRVQLRQHEASEDAVFAIGPYSFQPGRKLLLAFEIVLAIVLSPLDDWLGSFVSNVVSGGLTAPFIALVWTLLYFRLREAKSTPTAAPPAEAGT